MKAFEKTTLIAVDFTSNSEHAISHAVSLTNIAERSHELTLVHVLENTELDKPYFEGDDLPSDTQKALLIEGAAGRLKKIIDNKFNEEDHVNFAIIGGKVYKSIPALAKSLDSEMIVMGTHGASGFQAFLGSNAARIIQTAPCPTTVVRDSDFEQDGYHNIILPLDLTKETKQKVAWTGKIAKFFNSTVDIVTVAEDDEFLDQRIKANMRQVEKFFEDNDIKYTSNFLTETKGNFAETTISFAEEKKGDLIVIMTQQEKSISEYLFGSYAQQVVIKSKIPVMAINPRAELEGKMEYRQLY